MLLFKRNLLSKRLVWEESQLKPPERRGKTISLFFKKQIQFSIMLEMSFPFYIHTRDRHPPIPTNFLGIQTNKSVHKFPKERAHFFCPRKREVAKKGIARRVKHKQSFAQNWRSRNIDWLLLRWRD